MYTIQQSADYLGLKKASFNNRVRAGKITPNKQGLFDKQYIHDIKAARLPNSTDIIVENRVEMLRIIKEGVSYEAVAAIYNISRSAVSQYFKGQSSKSQPLSSTVTKHDTEFIPTQAYHCAVTALNKVVRI